jgi:hypothetical protein
MSPKSTPNGLCLPCGLQPFERNRYFDGKLLVTRDFQDEQNYLRGKDRLHNSLLHGVGTVCGLKVEQHPNPACRRQYVVLEPGLALDCCGNEIIVNAEQTVDLRALIEATLRTQGPFPTNVAPTARDIFLRIAYTECDTEPVPALLDDCGCEGSNTEFNRTAEGYRLFVDLNEPVNGASDPLDARLEWRHTLVTSHPRAMVADRALQRLYVADWDGSGGWLRMYDTSNHSLVTPAISLSEDSALPVAASRSNLGDLVYVAVAVEEGGNGSTTSVRILLFDQNRLESNPAEALRASLSVDAASLAGLEVSPLDDSLYALLPDGRLLRWSSNSIRDWVADSSGSEPAPIVQDLRNADPVPAATTVTPDDMTISYDGRWMVVADSAQPRLIVLYLAQFAPAVPLVGDVSNLMKAFALPAGHTPAVVEFSYDGAYLYVLGGESQMLYRIEVRTSLADFIPIIPDEGNTYSAVKLANAPAAGDPPKPLPLDMGISPRDNWLYILRREFDAASAARDQGEVLILSVDAINERRGPGVSDLESTPEIGRGVVKTLGNALFQNLAFLGQRLYVAGETLSTDAEDESTQGSISILFANEAACDAFIDRAIEGCVACADPSEGVIIASILGYRWDEPMTTDAAAGVNLIDNLTHRPMVPSTNTLRQVIECMLEKGISEGIPGPRGPVGPEGDAGPRGPGVTAAQATTLAAGSAATAALLPIMGDPEGDQRLMLGIPRGADGAPGNRGPGITQAVAATLPPGSSATAALVPIPGDPEGDQRLLLGLPRGADGAPGNRGPGITQAVANTLPPGSAATANLVPIPGDPEGDQRLVLGIPRGDPGQGTTPREFNRVVFASWHQDEVLTADEFVERLATLGLVVVFKNQVRVDAIHYRHAFARVRRLEQASLGMLECECIVPMGVGPVDLDTIAEVDVKWLIGILPTDDKFQLVTKTKKHSGGTFSRALCLHLPEQWADPAEIQRLIKLTNLGRLTLTVVLRSEWILDESGRALDGDHIWPGVPAGATAAGVDGRPSGNGTEGGDWISVLHIVDGDG